GLFDLLVQLPVHVAFAVALGFLTDPTPESAQAAAALALRRRRRWLDGTRAALALACAAYYVAHQERLKTRMAGVDPPEMLAVAGSSRGGAGKVAVISSGLFGTVNGSAIANAVTTGAFTIPLMMRAGYRPAFAAGVEACASMGGQLIPPVMGAAAFIMAETL